MRATSLLLAFATACAGDGAPMDESSSGAPIDTVPDIGGTTVAEECPEVHVGDLVIDDATDLATLAMLGEVTGNVTIARPERGLEDLSALACLARIGKSLAIRSTPGLVDLTGVSRLAYVDTAIELSENPDLVSLGGLDALAYVPWIRIGSHPSLARLDLRELQAVDVLTIGYGCGSPPGYPALVAIDSMDAMLSLGRLEIAGASVLTSLDGIAALGRPGVQVGSMDLLYNPALDPQHIAEVAAALDVPVSACANLGESVDDCWCPPPP